MGQSQTLVNNGDWPGCSWLLMATGLAVLSYQLRLVRLFLVTNGDWPSCPLLPIWLAPQALAPVKQWAVVYEQFCPCPRIGQTSAGGQCVNNWPAEMSRPLPLTAALIGPLAAVRTDEWRQQLSLSVSGPVA